MNTKKRTWLLYKPILYAKMLLILLISCFFLSKPAYAQNSNIVIHQSANYYAGFWLSYDMPAGCYTNIRVRVYQGSKLVYDSGYSPNGNVSWSRADVSTYNWVTAPNVTSGGYMGYGAEYRRGSANAHNGKSSMRFTFQPYLYVNGNYKWYTEYSVYEGYFSGGKGNASNNDRLKWSGSLNFPDHTAGGWESDDNNHYRKCTVCGTTMNSSAHTWSGYTITQKPTCDTPGSKYRTCTVCGKKQTVEIAALGHTYDTEWSMNETHHYHLCLRCGAKADEAPHGWKYVTYIPAADAKLTFETGDLTVYGGEGSKSQAYTYTGDGEISVTSSNTDVATASVNENTVTVEYVKPGTSTITVSAPKTKKFNEISQTFEVTCEKTKLTVPTLSGTSFTITGQTVGPQIYNFNGNTMTQSGTTSSNVPGNYSISWNLKDTNKYCWADGTTTQKSQNWKSVGGNITYYIKCSGTGYDCSTYWANAHLGSSGRSVSNTGSASITKPYSAWKDQKFNDEIGYVKSGGAWYPTSLDLYNLRGWRRNQAYNDTESSITYLKFNTKGHAGPHNGETYLITQ